MYSTLDDGSDRWGMITFPGLDGVAVPIELPLGLLLLLAALALWARDRTHRHGPAGTVRLVRITSMVGAALVLLAALLVIAAPGQPEVGGGGGFVNGLLLVGLVVSIATPGLIVLGLALGLLWARMRPQAKE